MKTLVILLLLAAHIGQVGSYIALANYNFYGLSSGTTNIQCTVDPVNNLDWQLASKSLQLILPNCNRSSFHLNFRGILNFVCFCDLEYSKTRDFGFLIK